MKKASLARLLLLPVILGLGMLPAPSRADRYPHCPTEWCNNFFSACEANSGEGSYTTLGVCQDDLQYIREYGLAQCTTLGSVPCAWDLDL